LLVSLYPSSLYLFSLFLLSELSQNQLFAKNFRSLFTTLLPNGRRRYEAFLFCQIFIQKFETFFPPDLLSKPLKEHPLFVKRDANVGRYFKLPNQNVDYFKKENQIFTECALGKDFRE